MRSWRAICLGALLLAAPILAEPARPVKVTSPLDTVKKLQGAVELHSVGQTIEVTLRGEAGNHLFRVETDLLTGLPTPFHAATGEVWFWRGHLVVVAPLEAKAWHFSLRGAEAQASPDGKPLPGAEMDATLRASYDLTRIAEATAVISRSGPKAFEAPKGVKGIFERTDYQDPGGGGGLGGCGTSCSISCGDGSSCSASCGSNRCASCSCPASCGCS